MNHIRLPTHILIIQLLSEEQYVYYVRIEAFLKNVWTKIFPDNHPHCGWAEMYFRNLHVVNPNDEGSNSENQDMVIAWEDFGVLSFL